MRTAWVGSGALRAPLCIQGDVMAHFAGRREISMKFPMRAAARPEIFEFSMAGGHRKFENLGPRGGSHGKIHAGPQNVP